jgi:hypothetical protein
MQHKKLTHFHIPLLKSEIKADYSNVANINIHVKILIFRNLKAFEYTVAGA